jgi:phage-related protein
MSSGLGVETPNARTYDQPTPEDRPSAAMVVNAGNATSSRVKITVHGPLVAGDWSLVNETTDQSQSIDLTIPVDGVIEIDSHEETVILAGVDYVSRTYGDWIRLAPGTNTLRLVTGATNEAAYMTVESYSSWR